VRARWPIAWCAALPIGAHSGLVLVMVGYLILVAVMDELAMILLAEPIVFPASPWMWCGWCAPSRRFRCGCGG